MERSAAGKRSKEVKVEGKGRGSQQGIREGRTMLGKEGDEG